MIRDDHIQMMSDDELIRLSNELQALLPTPEEIKAMNDLLPTPEEIKAMNDSCQQSIEELENLQ